MTVNLDEYTIVDRIAGTANSGFKKLSVKWLIEHL